MRENPWHIRIPTSEHHQWFKLLVQNYDLTLSWLGEISPPGKFELEPLISRSLGDFLDDTSPQDVLKNLESTIWKAQIKIISTCFRRTPTRSDRDTELETLLSNISWRAGKEAAKSNWPQLTSTECVDLNTVFHAAQDTPFSGYPDLDAFLVRRSLTSEIQVEQRKCPHQSKLATKPIVDRLCRFHAQWLRGYTEMLNPKITLEHSIESPRCLLRWFMASH